MITFEIEKESDIRIIEENIKVVFNNLYEPGCNEHLIAHNLRKSSAIIKELNLVLKKDDNIIGHIMYSRAKIENSKSKVALIGPLWVKKEYQNKGYGKMIVNESLKLAKDLGYELIVLYGFPNLYLNYGFEHAAYYNISAIDGSYPTALMVYELKDGVLQNSAGKLIEEFEFMTDEKELKEFDKGFDELEKKVLDCQNDFNQMLESVIDKELVGSKILLK